MTSDSRLWTRGDTIRWGLVLLLLAVEALWLKSSGRTIGAQGLEGRLQAFAALGAISGFLVLVASRQSSRRLRIGELAVAMHSLCWLTVFMSSMCVLSYLLVTLAPPLIDGQLAATDAALGFHWPAVHAWVRARTELSEALDWCYNSGRMELFLVPLAIALFGPVASLREFLSGLFISLSLVLLVSTPFPASGAYHYFGGVSAAELAQTSHFIPLRDGTLRVFDLEAAQGLVSMPSFHTVMGLLFIQAMWWSRLALIVVLPFNVVMILSTPTQGGHYLADVLAGVAVWAITAALVRALRRAGNPLQWVAAIPLVPAGRFGRAR